MELTLELKKMADQELLDYANDAANFISVGEVSPRLNSLTKKPDGDIINVQLLFVSQLVLLEVMQRWDNIVRG